MDQLDIGGDILLMTWNEFIQYLKDMMTQNSVVGMLVAILKDRRCLSHIGMVEAKDLKLDNYLINMEQYYKATTKIERDVKGVKKNDLPKCRHKLQCQTHLEERNVKPNSCPRILSSWHSESWGNITIA